tara:strand:+ start:7780 stop:9612 length:1833 start_codon:yes stop_codon:yes gene_type:complete
MCGIAGYIGSPELYPKKNNINKCKNLMLRRGPDNFNLKEFKNKKNLFLFMHSRLSIIDPLKKSNQPMEDERGILTFNGEIYNYLELKKNLENIGCKFKTNSDTEVLLKMLNFYGSKALNLLDGMWAFAYYNKKTKETFLSRDRFGEKPLYILRLKNNFFFGSNINYLLSLSQIKPDIKFDKIENYLNFGFRSIDLNNSTFFENIYNLKANSFIKISEKNITKSNFWNFRKIKINKKITFQDSVELLKTTFSDSLKKRLRSDFPIACLLSGGIDSNSIVSFSKKKFDLDMNCYSIKSKDYDYNETNLIDETVKKLNLKHSYVFQDKNFSYDSISKIIEDGAYPVSSITFLLYYFLNQHINKNKIRVLMSGIGSDELFAGYYTHQMYYLYENKKKKLFKKIHKDWFRYIKPLVRNKNLKDFNYYSQSIKKVSHVLAANDIQFSNMLKKKGRFLFDEKKYFKNFFKNQLANDLFLHIVPPQLRDSDQISMYFGIENRSPFLSKDLFELAYSLNNNFLIQKGYGKFVLREAMRKTVSDKILDDRNKVGFNMNINSIFNTKSKQFKDQLFQNNRLNKIINEKKIIEVSNKEKVNNQESHMLFSILNVAKFLNIYE